MARRAHQNQLESPLLRLPDSLLVQIMATVNVESLLKLRHTCRDFMRLFSTEQIFKIHHLTPTLDLVRFRSTARIWTPPTAFFPGQTESWMGPLCPSCCARRNGDLFYKKSFEEMQTLYCSGCQKPHKEMHFSHLMRFMKDDNRLCFGREYALPICCNKQLSLHDFKLYTQQRPNERLVFLCAKSHDALRCTSPSCGNNGQPVFRCYTDIDGETRLHLEFAAHINFKKLPSGKACVNSLVKEIDDLAKMPGVGHWKDSSLFRQADPARCFDPNICDCVEHIPTSYEGSSPRMKVRSDYPTIHWQSAPTEGHYITTTGRCAFSRHGFTTHYNGIEVNVDFMRCEDRSDRLVLKQTVDCAVDTTDASSAGWANLVSRLSYDPTTDPYLNGLVTCSDSSCGLSNLSVFHKNAFLYWG